VGTRRSEAPQEVNPFSALSWIWKALRGHSVTFAALFALAVAGVSVLGWVKAGLRAAGASWFMLLIIPTVLIAVLAKKETDWIPEQEVRRRWARSLVFASLLAAIATRLIFPPPPAPESTAPAPVRMLGPRSK